MRKRGDSVTERDTGDLEVWFQIRDIRERWRQDTDLIEKRILDEMKKEREAIA